MRERPCSPHAQRRRPPTRSDQFSARAWREGHARRDASARYIASRMRSVRAEDPRRHLAEALHRDERKEREMPTYEYGCNKCGHGFTQFMHIDEQDKAKVRCPKCKDQ